MPKQVKPTTEVKQEASSIATVPATVAEVKPKQSKAKKVAAEVPVVVEPVAEVTDVPVTAAVTEPKKEKAIKVKKEKVAATTEPTIETATVAPVESAVTGTVESAEGTAEPVIATEKLFSSDSIATKVKGLMMLSAEILRDARALEKAYTKELKVAQKAGQKRKRKTSKHTPSGFTKPAAISDEMAVFLGQEPGSLAPRLTVTNAINAYIKLHDLQYKPNKKVILADEKLQALLKIPQSVLDENKFTYFELQSYLKPHFPKVVLDTAVVASV